MTGRPAVPPVPAMPAAPSALEALRRDWGRTHAIGRDGDHHWWSARLGREWAIITADEQGALREAMTRDCLTGPVTQQLWCGRCGKPLTAGGDGRAVHAAAGAGAGAPDGHFAAPVDHEPPLWKAAREIAADYAGTFEVDATFGFLRADWVVSGGGVPVHYEARTEQEMRARLDEALAVSRRERSRGGAVR